MSARATQSQRADALQVVEVLIGSSSYLKGDAFRLPVRALHEVVHDLKLKHPRMLENVDFERHTYRPFSPDIQRALTSMQVGRLASLANPTFKWLTVESNARSAFMAHMRESAMPQLEQLMKLVNEFDALLSAWLETNGIAQNHGGRTGEQDA